jgi:2-polyprenyl-3-methyl-5-hydroxy-6-metoxy-1,4-benzoquinol methylase
VVRKRKSGKWYVDFFREGFYYRTYAPMGHFHRTEEEAEFIVQALGLEPGAAILDLGCGQGRHTVALARRGYRMTGLDLTALHLRLARRAAREAGVEVRWQRADMRDILWEEEFDAVINMFTTFGYLESDEEDFKVLQAVARSLRPGGRFLIDTINRERLMRRWEELPARQKGLDGTIRIEERSFDFLTSRQRNRVVAVYPDGTRDEREIHLRLYTLTELTKMLSRAGLEFRRVWGWYGGQDYGFDSVRMIVLAEKER